MTVQVLVARGVAPAQVGVEHVAGEIVGEQAVAALLHERQRPQPGEQLGCVLSGECRPQQVLGREAGVGTDGEGLPAARVRDVADEPLDQHLHDVGGVDEVDGAAVPRRALVEYVDHQGERERMTVGEGDQLVVPGRVDLSQVEVVARLLGGEVVERHDPRQLLPGRVGPPGRWRRVPARDDDERARRQPGDELVPEPAGQRLGPLEGVHEHGDRRCGRSGGAELGREPIEERRGSGVDGVHVQPDDAGAGGRRHGRDAPEEHGLADAARAVDEQHREGTVTAREGRAHEGDLLVPADEPALCRPLPAPADGPLRRQAGRDGGGGRLDRCHVLRRLRRPRDRGRRIGHVRADGPALHRVAQDGRDRRAGVVDHVDGALVRLADRGPGPLPRVGERPGPPTQPGRRLDLVDQRVQLDAEPLGPPEVVVGLGLLELARQLPGPGSVGGAGLVVEHLMAGR
jgi:hypothetical protein